MILAIQFIEPHGGTIRHGILRSAIVRVSPRFRNGFIEHADMFCIFGIYPQEITAIKHSRPVKRYFKGIYTYMQSILILDKMPFETIAKKFITPITQKYIRRINFPQVVRAVDAVCSGTYSKFYDERSFQKRILADFTIKVAQYCIITLRSLGNIAVRAIAQGGHNEDIRSFPDKRAIRIARIHTGVTQSVYGIQRIRKFDWRRNARYGDKLIVIHRIFWRRNHRGTFTNVEQIRLYRHIAGGIDTGHFQITFSTLSI